MGILGVIVHFNKLGTGLAENLDIQVLGTPLPSFFKDSLNWPNTNVYNFDRVECALSHEA